MLRGTVLRGQPNRCEVHYTTAFRWRRWYLGALASDGSPAERKSFEAEESLPEIV
jgi:hypothetical protein